MGILSEKSFKDYQDNYHNPNHETAYFGLLCNDIPGYEFDDSIPTDIITQTGNNRPIVVSHNSFDHPFVHDYYNGIFKEEVLRRIKEMMGEE